MFIIKAFFILSISLGSYQYDDSLSKKLNLEYKKIITKTDSGKEFYKRFLKYSKKMPKIYLRYFKDKWFGYYDVNKDRIYLNTKYIMLFFDISNYTDEKIIEIMNFSDRVRSEFVKYSDTIFLHELVHALQDRIYKRARYVKELGLYLEFEYEAYLLSDIYFYEKLEKNISLFEKIISNDYYDLYTAYNMACLFEMSMDINEYKKAIEKRYLKENAGYVSLNEKEQEKKIKLEEKKLISYATGDEKGFKIENMDYEKIKKQKEEYQKFIDDFYNQKWPLFSFKVLNKLVEISYKTKNYYLLFKALYAIKKKSDLYKYDRLDLLDKNTKDYKSEFVKWCRLNCKKIKWEDLFLTIMSFEKFIDIEKDEFPLEIYEIKKDIYNTALKKYYRLYETEKDDFIRDEYKNYIDYIVLKSSDNNLIK